MHMCTYICIYMNLCSFVRLWIDNSNPYILQYGVATISRLPKNISLFCKRAL